MALFIGVTVLAVTGSSQGAPAIDGIPCERGERLNYHVHARLSVFIDGQPVTVPAEIGIVDNNCFYWLHTHTADGLIHVEAPEQQDFTLGQFFHIWGQDLSSTTIMGQTVGPGKEIRAFVNGQPFTGDPAAIKLDDRATILLEYGPPFPQ